MEDKSIFLSDFAAAVREQDRIAPFCTADRWELVSYETAAVCGTMLTASQESWPRPVTVCPGLTGWHRIFVCMADFGGGILQNHIDLRLTDDPYSRSMRAGSTASHVIWNGCEQVAEAFWRCADMTGQELYIEKVDDKTPHTANLLWLRFVPMTDDEVETELQLRADTGRKTVFSHMDGDFHLCDAALAPEDYCKPLYALQDSDVGIVSQEVSNDLIDYASIDLSCFTPRNAWTYVRTAYTKHTCANREAIYPVQIGYAHRRGMQMFAAHRMQLSNFCFPMSQPVFQNPFVAAHPELRTRSRTGTACEFLSYAYRETQDYMIGHLLESARHGFDGLQLIFIRGQHVLFEEPAAARYRQKYPEGPEFCRLPAGDPRLHEIRSDVMTEFFARLRSALQEYAAAHGTAPLKVYVNVYYTAEESLADGLDVERFAAEGLIDGIIQSNMSVREETEDLLAPDGLVDLARYAAKAETEYVVRRHYGNDLPRILAGIPDYRRIADRYGIAFHTELPWENTEEPEVYAAYAREVYAAGGMYLSLWDCYPSRVQCLTEWSCTARLGDGSRSDQMPAHPPRFWKILSWNGRDLRYYHPGWRG